MDKSTIKEGRTIGFSSSIICIIESVGTEDVASGHLLYKQLHADTDFDMPCVFYQVRTKPDFLNVLSRIEQQVERTNKFPIIHLCMHGDQTGIELMNGDCVDWIEMRDALTSINIKCRNNLFLTLAVCGGIYLMTLITTVVDGHIGRSPFWGFIGHENNVSQGWSFIAFYEFYKTLSKESDFHLAFKRLNNCHTENQLNHFGFVDSEYVFKKIYTHYKRVNCDSEALKVRAKAIIRNSGNGRKLPGMTRNRSLKQIQFEIIEYSKQHIIEMWERFFMVDLYPDNKKRFPFRYRL